VYVKICGVTSPADVDTLAGLGVDFMGIWHGTGGRSDVDTATVARLCRRGAGRIVPVLVTLLARPEELHRAVRAAGAPWVQLHGYQLPSTVRQVKANGHMVIKTLHVRGGDCLESALIRPYERAGVDLFLLDTLTADGRIGSTGERLDSTVVARLAGALSRPFLLAGGLSADRTASHPPPGVTGPAGMCGVDIDSAARGPDGRICPDQVAAIVDAWTGTDRPTVAAAYPGAPG
jgi:phosphoribosylanthranilate isomerase